MVRMRTIIALGVNPSLGHFQDQARLALSVEIQIIQ